MCTFGMEGPSPTGSNTASGEIVAAARAAFSGLGFGKTTIREVARRAGVTHGLVIRHFGSKEQLFLAAVPSPRTRMAQVAGDLKSLPTRSARSYVRRMTLRGGNDSLSLVGRSATGHSAADVVQLGQVLMREGESRADDVLAQVRCR
ncbi:helix-turn-helix domain-containing protein [Streptomyces sp. NPDC050704]|uniref:helix-turn-helix domain-containing protein n=1 Tax=Streptomyces sp. NPDC050704 TaxID=3157219 RepID=UPI00341D5AEB